MAGELLMVTATVRLEWGSEHWDSTACACRICRVGTLQRDWAGAACHQVCAEKELSAERVGQLTGRVVDERSRPSARQRRRQGGAR